MKFILIYYFIYSIYFFVKFINPSDFVAFLNVGQGDAIFIKSAQLTGLVDGGPDYTLDRFVDNQIPFFNCDLDFILATHPHKDHIAGLNRVLKRCKSKRVLINYVEYKSGEWSNLLNQAMANSKIYSYPDLSTLRTANLTITFLAKSSKSCGTDVNVCSLVTV